MASMLIWVALAGPAMAQANARQITGTPASPDATTTIDGRTLPPPPRLQPKQI
jgi:hypothetical protein